MSIRSYKVEITSLLNSNSQNIISQLLVGESELKLLTKSSPTKEVLRYYNKLKTGKELAQRYNESYDKSETSNSKDIQCTENTFRGTVRKLPALACSCSLLI